MLQKHFNFPHTFRLRYMERAASVTMSAHGVVFTAKVHGGAAPAVVARVDAEHQQVDDLPVQHFVGQPGGVGAQGDVPDHALPFQRLDVVQYAALNGLFQVGLLVDTVESRG